MKRTLHTYKRPEAESLEGAFVCCGGNEGFTQGSPWGAPWDVYSAEDDLTVAEVWDF